MTKQSSALDADLRRRAEDEFARAQPAGPGGDARSPGAAERQRVEAALRNFSRVIEQTASTVLITDVKGVIEYVNPRFCEASGYAAEEAIGRRPDLLKSGHTSEAEYRELWRTISSGGVWRGEFRNRRKDGSLYWEAAIISPVVDERGQVTHFVGIQDDITARKEAEAALHASEARFRQLFELAPVPQCYITKNGVLIDLNRRFVESFGYTPEDAPTLDAWWRLAFPGHEHRRKAMANWEAAVRRATDAGNDIGPLESRVTCKSGEVRTVVITGVIVGDSVLASFFDVTERKRAEQALHESEEKLRLAIDGARIGMWDWNIASREVVLSPRCSEILARDPDEATNYDTFFDAGDADDRERIRRAVGDALEQRADYDVEYRVRWPDDTLHWVAARGRGLYGPRGEPARMVGIALDISERKRNEATVHGQRVEMEQLTRRHVASQTVAAMAHELNQPLTAVSAYAVAALRLLRAGDAAPDKLDDALGKCTRQAQRAGQVVRDLLRFLQMGEDKIDAVDLNRLVRNAVTMVKADYHGDFHAVLELEPDLAPVRANRLQVEKVLVNLVQNGVEAMRDAGVDPQFITITGHTAADGEMAHVTVSDSGPGLDDQTLHRIFDPFFSTKASGLGMGLPISRTIIEDLGGQLWVESDPGRGASFHFTLPFAQ